MNLTSGRLVMASALAIALWSGCASNPPPPDRPAAVQASDRIARQATALSEQQRWTAAAGEWQRALNQFRLLHQETNEAIALHNLGWAQWQQRHTNEAHENFQQALELNERLGRIEDAMRNRLALVQVDREAGYDVEGQLIRLKTAVPSPADLGLQGYFLNEYGLWQLQQGKAPEALHTLRKAELAFDRQANRGGVAAAVANQAEAALAQTNQVSIGQSLGLWRRSLDLYEQLGEPRGIARALAGLGRTQLLLAREGNSTGPMQAEALMHLERAASNYRLLGMEEAAQEVDALISDQLSPGGLPCGD